MIGKGFDVLTPFSKLHRVSYKFDKSAGDTFVVGEWGELAATGEIAKAGSLAAASTANFKLVLTRVSDSIYEAHDVAVGRITAIDDVGTRIYAEASMVAGGSLAGIEPLGLLTVETGATGTGLIKTAVATNTVVGVVQEVHPTYIVYSIAAPGTKA